MPDADRRQAARREVKVPVVMMTVSGSLNAETLDISHDGALVRAKGHLTILLEFKGARYRGRLVRAMPVDAETGDYGIKFDDPGAFAAIPLEPF